MEHGRTDLKKQLRNWEKSFEARSGRRPSKEDISKVPEIAQLYKQYARLKSNYEKSAKVSSSAHRSPPPSQQQSLNSHTVIPQPQTPTRRKSVDDNVVYIKSPVKSLRTTPRKNRSETLFDVESPSKGPPSHHHLDPIYSSPTKSRRLFSPDNEIIEGTPHNRKRKSLLLFDDDEDNSNVLTSPSRTQKNITPSPMLNRKSRTLGTPSNTPGIRLIDRLAAASPKLPKSSTSSSLLPINEGPFGQHLNKSTTVDEPIRPWKIDSDMILQESIDEKLSFLKNLNKRRREGGDVISSTILSLDTMKKTIPPAQFMRRSMSLNQSLQNTNLADDHDDTDIIVPGYFANKKTSTQLRSRSISNFNLQEWDVIDEDFTDHELTATVDGLSKSNEEEESSCEEIAQKVRKSVKKTTTQKQKKVVTSSEEDSENESEDREDCKEAEKKSNGKKVVTTKKKPRTKAPSVTKENSLSSNYRSLKLKTRGKGKSAATGKYAKYGKKSKLPSYNNSKSATNESNLEDNSDTLDGFSYFVDNSITGEDENNVECDFLSSEEGESSVRIEPSLCGGNEISVDLQKALKCMTGYSSFREGQYVAIERILNGQSTLVVLPTGSGKSLCYQLPTFILRQVSASHGFTLVISPMISLMVDQLRCLPRGIRGAILSSGNQKPKDQQKILEELQAEKIDLLFITPERLNTSTFLQYFEDELFPSVQLACIDEVHCVSEWSHNFRTSYLHLGQILKNTIKPNCVLGLTGTATKDAQISICEMLDMSPEDDVIQGSPIRDNLRLTVSKVDNDDDRQELLLSLLKSKLFKSQSSIIVYTMFQSQADQLAYYLRSRQINAESYHAGKEMETRQRVQTEFMDGKIQVLIATVAFGLGLNKEDVRSVVHYNMPKSLENYIQEIGRSGRDGLPSYCHLFLSKGDYIKQRSFAFSEYVNEDSLLRFLHHVFAVSGTKSKKSGKRVRSAMFAISVEEAEKLFDMKENIISTLLSYISLGEESCMSVYPECFKTLRITFTKTRAQMLAEINPIVKCALESVSSNVSKTTIEVDTLIVANKLELSPQELTTELYDLQKRREIRFEKLNKAFQLELKEKWYSMDEELRESYIDQLHQTLLIKIRTLEESRVNKLDKLYETLYAASYETLGECDFFQFVVFPYQKSIAKLKDSDVMLSQESRQKALNDSIQSYFQTREADELINLKRKGGFRDPNILDLQKESKSTMELEMKTFIRDNKSVITTGLEVARIFHGLQSPNFTAAEWNKNSCWGKYSHFNFKELMRLADKALKNVKAKKETTDQSE